MLADNKIAMNAAWDDDLLKMELHYLSQLDIDVNVDLTGFSMGEIDILLGAVPDTAEPEPPPPAPPTIEDTVTQLSYIWLLGPHRIRCGNCCSNYDVDSVMDFYRASMVITDPPYNLQIGGFVSGLGSIRHDEFAMASGEMTSDEFSEFLFGALLQLESVCVDGALLYTFMDWRHQFELLIARQ